jgi:hypothetical protein
MAPGAHSRKRTFYDEAELTPTMGVGNNPVVDRQPIDVEMDSSGYLTNETASNSSNNTTNMEIQTFSTEMARSSSSVTAGRGHHGETMVSKKTTRFNPIDETEQVIMPYRVRGTMAFASNQRFATALTFRLNSIYDIIQSINNADYNVEKIPVADSPDPPGSIQVPHYREFWSKLYNYWHVVKCEWSFHYRYSAVVQQMTEVDYNLIIYEHGLQTPPTYADMGGSPVEIQNIPWYIRKYHPHTRMVPIKTFMASSANGDVHVTNQWQTISGVFKPGNISHEVVEDEFNQTWHKWAEVPPTAEKLTILLQPKDRIMDENAGYSTSANTEIKYVMTMHYTVQLKDRIHTFQYLTQGTDFPQTSNILVQPSPL